MDHNDETMDETVEEKSFAELLAETPVDRGRLEQGQRVEAIVVHITPEWVFLDLGGKSEGYLDRKELLDEDGRLTVKEGDTIVAYYLSSRQNEKLFTTRITGGQAARNFLEDAFRSGIPVEGVVEKEVKGGFEVKVAGTLRGFCPFSLASLRRMEDPNQFVGQRLSFKVSEYGEGGRNIILSRRAILEEEQLKKKEALKGTLREGMTVRGAITAIRDFGAFVDIGGVQAMLPISEVGWDRVKDIRDRLAVGQEVEAAVLKLDWDKDRITLSLKQTLPDPWERVEERYPEGSFHAGQVARLTEFGAFVSLEAGVDGLLHISKLGVGKRIKHPREVLTEGQAIQVKVEALDKGKRRLSLSLAGPDAQDGHGEEDYREYVGTRPRAGVTFGEILKSKLAGEEEK